MAKKLKHQLIANNDKGFTLIEVLIATGIFSVFMAAYMVAQGFNIADSTKFSEQLKLRSLADQKINELVVNPPEFVDSLTLTPETKSFEDDEQYEYTLEWKKFKLPDLAKIKGEEEESLNDPIKQVEKKLFEKIKENMEKMIWQLAVTVTNKTTGEKYSLSTWLYDGEAELTTDSF